MQFRPLFVLGAFSTLVSAAAAAEEKITFNEHIRPILSDNCFACHGSDAEHRKGKLRLDTAEGATRERNDLRPITPGDLENSDLWHRIVSTDEEEMMPPPESHKKPLTAAHRELIKTWIEQGAVYQKHWAYEPIARPEAPVVGEGEKERRDGEKERQSERAAKASSLHPSVSPSLHPQTNPVDAFILAKLAARGLAFSPEASPKTLVRRLTLDLTGLPPTPEDVDAFVADSARNPQSALRTLVDRLLASPRYGEHFGRYWLDAVRYADTHGLHLDNIRTIWPYRDWVVQAFNRNLPFDEFTIEQLAGDQLKNPTVDQLVASGYNRNNLTTSEGGTIEGEAEMRNTADRTDTTAAVWMGLTANCASCHDHKFDPLTQREYYSLGAIFKGLADRVWDGNIRSPGPIAILADNPATQRRIAELATTVKPLEAALTARADVLVAQEPLMKTAKGQPVAYEVVWAEDSDLPRATEFRAAPPAGEWREGSGVPVAGGKRALRLEGNAARPFTFTAGDVDLEVRTEARAFVSFQADPARPPRAVSLEFVSEEKTKRMIWGDRDAFGPEVARTAQHAGPLPAPGAYARLELNACESGVNEGKTFTGLRIAQSDGAAWWDRAGVAFRSPSAADDPLLSGDAWTRGLQREIRFVENTPFRHDIKFLVGLSPTQQNAEEKARRARYHRDYIYGPLRAALESEHHAVRKVLAEQIHYEHTLPSTLISQERAEPLPAHILIRGQYDKPGELVQPATPAFLPPPEKKGERLTRLEFARWLVDPKHPLTARVTVNRFWGQLFGAGLVRTPADFGAQGEPPTHPDLLDWLASEFMRTGWDVKALVRLLVTSRAYRQSSDVTPALLETDPANKLLARGPRIRLDAEVLRDQALALGGLLVPDIGGPPVKPYQPSNIWEPVAFGGSNTKEYVQDHGAALYRRSLYTFWKRTAPAPAMATFDAPSRENFCVGRGRSNTPLQALALMNDVQQFEAARAFAERLLRRTSSEPERLEHAFRCATARPPTAEEKTLLAETLATHRAHFEKNAEAASALLANGESKPAATLPVVDFAAWTMVANLLLNLDETVTRN